MRKTVIFAFLLLTATAKAQSCPDANHPHAIDLGLPSGTKWACCNIGAKSPEGDGAFYAFGENKEKGVYSRRNYQHRTAIMYHLNYKTCWDDKNTVRVVWGAPWLMPTPEQFKELVDNCSSKWTAVKGVNGRLLTGKNGASIFLPAAGQRNMFSRTMKGSFGHYWTERGTDDREAYFFFFSSASANSQLSDPCIGRTIRAVVNKD